MRSDTRASRGRALLTGSHGFTGQYVASLLSERGYEVMGASEPNFDLRRPDSIDSVIERAQPDYVIHLAGISFVGHQDAKALYEVNTAGTACLLASIARLSPWVKKIVLASTSQVYGNSVDDPITESTPPAPISHYACSKLSMEFMAKTWFDRLPIIITRPFNCIGVGQASQFLLPKLVDHFQRRAPVIELGNLDVERDFVDIRSVADVYVKLLESAAHSLTVNIASGVGRSLTGIIADLVRITGHRLKPESNVAFVRINEVKRLVGSNACLADVIGPLRYLDFEATLRWMLDSQTQPA